MATEFILRYGQEIIVADKTVSASLVASGSGRISVSEALVPSDDLLLPNFALDISALKAMMIISSVAVTFKTYLAEVEKDQISLRAGEPYVWHENHYFGNLLQNDCDNAKVTEAGGSEGTIAIEVITDATPP